MSTFTPPTVQQAIPDRLWGRYSIPVGQSVVLIDGTYRTVPYPWIGELAGTEGTHWFLGGRTYEISDAVATALLADGFDVEQPPGGYGLGGYGTNGYGI